MHCRWRDPRGICDIGGRGKHVLGQGEYDRAGAARLRDAKGTRYILGNALGAIDLRHPFDDAAVHAAVVDLLEGLAIGKVAADLAHEYDHRCGVLRGSMDADRGVRGARSSRDEHNAGTTGQLAAGLGHVRGAAFLTADDQPELLAHCIERVEHRQIALAGNAERELDALSDEVVDEYLTAGAHHERRITEPSQIRQTAWPAV